MKNIVKVEIQGTRPIMFHKFNPEVVSSLTKVKTGSAGNNPEEWKDTFFEKNNQLYVPGSYLFSTFKAGSVYTKAGRGTIQKAVVATMIIEDEVCLLDRWMPENWREIPTAEFERDSSKPVYLDIRGVTNPNSKGKNVRYRIACAAGWKLSFTMSWDDTILSQSQIKKVIEDSGKMIGIAEARTLGYGRFDLLSFDIIK